MYTNILSAIDMNISVVERIISDAFDGKLSAMLFQHTKAFKKFSPYVAEKYKIHELNIWEYIANMENLHENYIDTYYQQFKPYFGDILKNPDLSLNFLKSHSRDIRRTGSFPIVLIFNKNIDRDYLIKNKRKCKNAIIHRMALLKHGDEYLFKKYRRSIKWDLMIECYTGKEDISINTIISYGQKYLLPLHVDILRSIQNNYINTMFVTK